MIIKFKLFELFNQIFNIDKEIELEDEFKCQFKIDDDTYFFHARDENKMFPESIRYGWHLTFGIIGPDKYKLTEKGIPFKVLSGIKQCFFMFIDKYNPDKLSFIAEGEKKAQLYLSFFNDNYNIDKIDSGLKSFSGPTPYLYMINKLKNYEDKDFLNIDYNPGKTSLNQISYGLKFLVNNFTNIKTNLDYGGGKYNLGTNFLKKYNITNFVYDIFNRTEEHNNTILESVKNGVDSVTLLNVLNTIKEKSTRLYVIRQAYSFFKDVMIITCYNGNNTGVGSISKSNTWQENRNVKTYIPEIKEALGDVNIEYKNLCLIIRKSLNENFSLKTQNGSIIKRSKFGVGKDIGDSIYIHKNYVNDVISDDLYNKFLIHVKNFQFNILKIKKDFTSITFINSKNFDTADEPSLYESMKVDITGNTKYAKYDEFNPPIYHHKWLFVKDDYKNFDVEKSKQRSQEWLSKKDIDFTRIGYKKYWDNWIK